MTISGPEISGARPVLVTFEAFKDREEVLRKGNLNKERKNKLQNVEIIFTNLPELKTVFENIFSPPTRTATFTSVRTSARGRGRAGRSSGSS